MKRPIHLEVLWCLAFGVFLAADGWPATIAIGCFSFFFMQWLGRLVEIERGAR